MEETKHKKPHTSCVESFLVRLQQLMLDAQLSSNHLCLANSGFRCKN